MLRSYAALPKVLRPAASPRSPIISQPVSYLRQAVPSAAIVISSSSSRRAFATTRPVCNMEVQLTAPNGVKWTQPLGLFINNEFVESSNGQKLTTINPTTEEDICSVYSATASDVDKAVAAARAAFRHPSWKRLTGTDRGRLLSALADLVEAHAETLATIETLDNGKPLSLSRSWDVPEVVHVLRYYAGWADKIHGQTIPAGPDKLAYTVRVPRGVCGQIIPWNYPLAMAGWKLGPALAAGNTVVLKPAEQTPLSALYLARLIADAGFPPGVVNVLNGRGAEAGAALAAHQDVDKLAFTGSTAIAREVMRSAAGTLKDITLEAGGKSPLIVFQDADLDQAARWAHEGVMSNQGQTCTATSRLLVHADIHDAFLARFRDLVRDVSVVGDPFDKATYQGPQVTRAQLDRVLSYVESAREEGAVVAMGGAPPERSANASSAPSYSRGFFVQPTVMTGVRPHMRVFREEIFGPCVAVTPFENEEEAVQLANDSVYGLAAAVFTRDLARAHRVAAELEAGMVWVNSSNDSDYRVPFGGVKQSGIGRELGEAGLDAYTTVKAVHVNLTSN